MQRRTFLGTTAGAAAALALGQTGTAAADAAANEAEAALMPDLPIIDAHHHVYSYPATANGPERHYLLPDLLSDIYGSGQRVIATCFCETYTMYREDGPVELRSLGETEFANSIAQISANGGFGPCRVAAGIVSFVDMRLGDKLKPVLEAHMAVAGHRLRAIRNSSAWDEYPVFGRPLDPSRFALLLDPNLQKGVAQLAPLGLAFDVFVFHTQLDQVTALAAAAPDTTIILDHLGTPLGIGPYASQREAVFADWRTKIKALSKRPNVVVKIGGMGQPMNGLPSANRKPRSHSEILAQEWRPYVETCIDYFGVDRCMFESNYPPDNPTSTYGGLWNAFKRLTAAYSPAERTALFSGTANRAYKLGIDVPA